jgi:CDP-4-dehydro-6-deoxyglucose reductase
MAAEQRHFYAVPVVSAWDETPNLRGVRLDLSALRLHHERPGQLLQMRLPGGEVGHFALATAPAAHGQEELLLRRGSAHVDELIAALGPGAQVEVTAPFGPGFPIEAADGRHVVMVATGSGITPLRALLHDLLERRGDLRKVKLFYGQRTPDSFPYSGEFPGWRDAGLDLHLVCSRADTSWVGERGYVQDSLKRELAHHAISADSVAYLCGVDAMVTSVRDLLHAAHLPAERILLNH